MGLFGFGNDKKESTCSSTDEKDFINKVSEALKEFKGQYSKQAITVSCSFDNGACYVFADVIAWYPKQVGNKIFQETRYVKHYSVSNMHTGSDHMFHVYKQLQAKFGNLVEIHKEKVKARIKQDKKEYKSRKNESLENISYLMEQLSIFEDEYDI